MATAFRWGLIALLVVIVGVVPLVWYRSVYTHGKRLRDVVPGQVYRSGQMTAVGFKDAVKRLGIRTIINLQNDFPDPDIRRSFWDSSTIKESDLCRQLGVRYVLIEPDLVSRQLVSQGRGRPGAIDQFLRIMDDPSVYPVLIHCRAGLHRTGVLSAVYRMEYQGWTNAEAFRELKAHGFGDRDCTAANDYVKQYVLTYRPRQSRNAPLSPKG